MWRTCAALAAVTAAWLAGLAPAGANPPLPSLDSHPANALCLACHDEELIVGRDIRQARIVDAVDKGEFGASAHAGMKCVECHPAEAALPHVPPEGLKLALYSGAVACQECHLDAYEGYKESPHGTMTKLGDARAPACGDCHGDTHYIQLIERWEEDDRAEACANCHSGATSSFLDAAPLHKHVSPGFLSTAYVAGIFLMILTATTLAFGIIHVELQMLRWLVRRVAGQDESRRASDGNRS